MLGLQKLHFIERNKRARKGHFPLTNYLLIAVIIIISIVICMPFSLRLKLEFSGNRHN